MLLPGCLVQDAWKHTYIYISHDQHQESNETKQMCILHIEAAVFCLQIILPIQTSSNILPPQVNSPTSKQLPTDVILSANGKVYLSPLPISSHNGFGIDLSQFLRLLGRDGENHSARGSKTKNAHKNITYLFKMSTSIVWWGFSEPNRWMFSTKLYAHCEPASARMTAASVDWAEVVTFPLRNWLSYHLYLSLTSWSKKRKATMISKVMQIQSRSQTCWDRCWSLPFSRSPHQGPLSDGWCKAIPPQSGKGKCLGKGFIDMPVLSGIGI